MQTRLILASLLFAVALVRADGHGGRCGSDGDVHGRRQGGGTENDYEDEGNES